MEIILIFYKYINNIFRLGFVLEGAVDGLWTGLEVFFRPWQGMALPF